MCSTLLYGPKRQISFTFLFLLFFPLRVLSAEHSTSKIISDNIDNYSDNEFLYTENGSKLNKIEEKTIKNHINNQKETNRNIKIKTMESGSCGTNVKWNLNSGDGKFTLTGSGAMTNYSCSDCMPYYSYKSNIKTIVVTDVNLEHE